MYKITNQLGDAIEILLYSLIDGSYSANRLITALSQEDPAKPITLRINSDGGDVFESIAIYNYLKDRKVHVVIDGICASGASIVAMSGQVITMNAGTMMMIHNPMTVAAGDHHELASAAETLEKLKDNLIDIYVSHTGLDREVISDLMDKETYLSPEEALKSGFCDEIAPAPQRTETPTASTLSYEDGVREERARLQALDDIYTPERASVINAAKYQTFQNARDIAVELLKSELKSEKSRPSTEGLTNFSAGKVETRIVDEMAQYINRRRGK